MPGMLNLLTAVIINGEVSIYPNYYCQKVLRNIQPMRGRCNSDRMFHHNIDTTKIEYVHNALQLVLR